MWLAKQGFLGLKGGGPRFSSKPVVGRLWPTGCWATDCLSPSFQGR